MNKQHLTDSPAPGLPTAATTEPTDADIEAVRAVLAGTDVDAARAPIAELPEYLKTEEFAARYRTTPGVVRYWDHIGRIAGVRVGKRKLYPRAEVERFDRALRAATEAG